MIRARTIAILAVAGLVSLGGTSAAEPRLAQSPSAFLRAQAASPVRWHAWNETNLAQAQAAGKSVYVFVGSELSELSRATIRDTFSRPETVAWLNESFFCVLVDADLQPEVAAYAQHFIASARQLRGWPVHLWLTPDLQPYDGANYLPPTEEWGRPGFLKSARAALEAWTADPARARAMATEARDLMQSAVVAPTGNFDLEGRLEKATEAWVAAADAKNGGFGSAPKHPEPELIRFLLKRGPKASAVALAAARAIVSGGLRDPKDGGFFRRTIDAEWKEPYRQKLASDQARIALALFDAADEANDESLRAAADGALRFVLKEMQAGIGWLHATDGTEGAVQPGRVLASAGAEGLLILALVESRDRQLMEEGMRLTERWVEQAQRDDIAGLRHTRRGMEPATAGDLLALARGLEAGGKREWGRRLAAQARSEYFDERAGIFMASRARPTSGIAFRVPALPEPLPAEVLALLAGVDGETAALLRRSLLSHIEYDELPSGAVLLALATGKE